jgi:ribonuclease T2
MSKRSIVHALTCAGAVVSIGSTLMLAALGCQNAGPPPAPLRHDSAAREYAQDRSAVSGREPRRGRSQERSSPGQFDFYLLNLSWSPEFCASHGDSPECGRGLGFVVHGMWPQDATGDYPEHCSDAPGPSNPQTYTDMFPTAGLVEHEWQTHGTCSGLPADDYFSQIRKAYAVVKIPQNIGAGTDGRGVPPGELLAQFAGENPSYPRESFALSCGNNRLTAVEICLSKDLRPESCQGVRSCRANVVKVTPR